MPSAHLYQSSTAVPLRDESSSSRKLEDTQSSNPLKQQFAFHSRKVPLQSISFDRRTSPRSLKQKTPATPRTTSRVVSHAINQALNLVGDLDDFEGDVASVDPSHEQTEEQAAYRRDLLSDDMALFYQELSNLQMDDDEYSCSSDAESEYSNPLYNIGTFSDLVTDFNKSQQPKE